MDESVKLPKLPSSIRIGIITAINYYLPLLLPLPITTLQLLMMAKLLMTIRR
jgi:hypothetical protein